ncbi:MAG: cytochrome d ubiquinol oxidase subunit II [Candidatus Solibacter usitatus]|nr:cytochrome d ubiquinol oxidase subunit II [Candidatus Solibacter usitatus]
MLPVIWFCIVAAMIAVYVVLDGFDLGAGIVHLCVARNETERRAVLGSIGPVWDGNEVWLLAAGGALYCAFPPLYASAFSGFYLPLMMVLWLLILRGIAVEFRNHLDNRVWKPVWDVTFCLASALLAIFLGAALGNVVRGVPLNTDGDFFLPLWTNWRPGPMPGILDWYTVLVGLFSLFALTQHGALWVAHKTEDALRGRARNVARMAWFAVAAFTVLVTIASFRIQPCLEASFRRAPAGFVFPALALVALLSIVRYRRQGEDLKAFLASSLFLAGIFFSAVFGLFPNLLPANSNPAFSLTVQNASAAEYGLRTGLIWFTPGIILAVSYAVFLYGRFAGKVQPADGGH